MVRDSEPDELSHRFSLPKFTSARVQTYRFSQSEISPDLLGARSPRRFCLHLFPSANTTGDWRSCRGSPRSGIFKPRSRTGEERTIGPGPTAEKRVIRFRPASSTIQNHRRAREPTNICLWAPDVLNSEPYNSKVCDCLRHRVFG